MAYNSLTQAEKDLIASEASSTNDDYKCIVNLFFIGAWDVQSLLVPYGSNPNLTHYLAHRVDGVATPLPYPDQNTTKIRVDDDDIPINEVKTDAGNKADPLGTANWRLHPSMVNLKAMWDAGNVAFIHDIGPVKTVTTKDNYLGGNPAYIPANLFNHESQQQIVQKGVTDEYFSGITSGWSGRSAELLDRNYNPNSNIKLPLVSSFSISSNLLQADPPDTFFPTATPARLLSMGNSLTCDQSKFEDALDKMRFRADIGNPVESENRLYKTFVNVFNTYANNQEQIFDLSDDLPHSIDDIFNTYAEEAKLIPYYKNPDTLVTGLKEVARAIYNRKSDSYNQRRQVLNIVMSAPWDMHAQLRHNFDVFSKGVDLGLQALIEALEHPDMNAGRSDGKTLRDEVVIVTQAEFARTLDSNSANGTDHGWAGLQMVIGNMVNGGLYPEGYQPNYDKDGPKSDGSDRVRFIPEVSYLQSHAKILNWFGMPVQLLHRALPGLQKFTSDGTAANNLDFVFPSGNYTLNFI